MSIDKAAVKANDEFEFLFGKPPLLEGEDLDHYMRLREAIVDGLNPKTVFDLINVHDQVNKLWEERRYRRAAAALINGGMQIAVKYFLEAIYDMPDDLILKYMSTNAKERKEVLSLLAQHGITMAELQAKAAQLEGGGIQMFDRLVTARESSRRMLLKEAQRSNRRHEGDPDGTAEQ
jgi:hypothetical protein